MIIALPSHLYAGLPLDGNGRMGELQVRSAFGACWAFAVLLQCDAVYGMVSSTDSVGLVSRRNLR